MLPLRSENRWSDLLAVLIETDPAPILNVVGLDFVDADDVTVAREVYAGDNNRIDIVLTAAGKDVAVIEVKVLAGPGRQQLERYEAARPDANRYVAVFPARLPMDTRHAPSWIPLAWEHILEAYATSANDWASSTATAWQHHLDKQLPPVSGDTRWSDLVIGDDFVVAMRTRLSWIYSNLEPPLPLEKHLVGSSAGASAVVQLVTDARVENYRVIAEVEERLSVREIPKVVTQTTELKGPSIKVALVQHGVETSSGFDWDYLHAMWPLMKSAGVEWVTSPARPKGHDRDGQRRIVASGSPRYLGIGFGEAQTKINRSCLFGIRLQLDRDVTLSTVVAAMLNMGELIREMATVPQPLADREARRSQAFGTNTRDSSFLAAAPILHKVCQVGPGGLAPAEFALWCEDADRMGFDPKWDPVTKSN